MDTTTKTEPPSETILAEPKRDTSGIAGHPRGLMVLFFTEFWERFSFYGMRALLALYMTHAATDGGLSFSPAKATSIVGTYLMSVYLMALPGGWIADQFLGARLAVLVGGVVIAAGHFSMAFPSLASFYGGVVVPFIYSEFFYAHISAVGGRRYIGRPFLAESGLSVASL